jgi:hypothetical protein
MLLGDGQRGISSTILGRQRPPRDALFDAVHRIASDRPEDLREQAIGVTNEHMVHCGRTFVRLLRLATAFLSSKATGGENQRCLLRKDTP